MHGAGITDVDRELYIAVGLSRSEEKAFKQVFEDIPNERKHIVCLPKGLGPLGYLMVGYSLVGKIQAGYPAFQERVGEYAKKARNWLRLSPIRE